jgi:hypothetical protein
MSAIDRTRGRRGVGRYRLANPGGHAAELPVS